MVRKLADVKKARRALVLLRDAFDIIGCDGRLLNMALDSEIKDLEDAVQYHSALHADSECLLSRNPDDFPRSGDCPVLTPTEFLASHSFQ